jgi:WD40 repeat protein/serine/threonine protein kinase
MSEQEIPSGNPPTLDSSLWPTEMPPPVVPGLRIGPYKLMQELGSGGYGVVFMADQSEPLRRRVALKIIRFGMDTAEVIARFQAERQALALMDHPNIAKVYDAGATPAGRPYFVMELVPGPKITDYCDAHKLSIADRLRLFLPVCQALQHAHQKGIIHRDIKPSNILVATADGLPVPKVIDFGIAKATGGRLTDLTLYTAHEQFFGTPAYMSPEQAGLGGLDIDTRSDIYSLGVLLYELLSGEIPLYAGSDEAAEMDEVRRLIREVEPPRPSVRFAATESASRDTIAQKRRLDSAHLVSALRGDLDWIVMKCLEKDRQRRYDNVSALAADIQRHLQHEPVLAGPPSTLYLLGKFARRHRAGLATATLFVGLLVAATAVSLALAGRARQAAADADLQRQAAEVQRREADKERRAVQLAYNQMDLAAALTQLGLDNPNEAVAYLCRALRNVPDNRNAASLLFSVLTDQSWLLPVAFFHSPAATFDVHFPSGRLATVEGNTTLRITDLASGRLLATLTTTAPIGRVAFSADGSRLLTEESSGARAGPAGRNGPGGAPPPAGLGGPPENNPGAPPRGQRGQRGNNAGGPGGFGRGFNRGTTGPVQVWDVATGRQLSPPGAFPANIAHAELNADGTKLLAAAGANVTVWDTASGQPLGAPLNLPGRIAALAWSADGRKFALALRNTTAGAAQDLIAVWDVASGQPDFRPVPAEGVVTALALSANASVLATGLNDGTARLWNAATGEPLGETMRHAAPVLSVTFSPDGRRLLTGSSDETARLWNAADSRTAGQPASAPLRVDGAVDHVAFDGTSRNVLTASATGDIQQWALPPTENNAAAAQAGFILPGAFSADGRRLLALLPDGSTQVWSVASQQPLSPPLARTAANPGPQPLARLNADGQLLALASDDRTLRVWDAASGQPVSPPLAQEQRVRSAAFNASGQRLLTTAEDNTARVWEVATGQAAFSPLNHTAPILAAAFGPDGQSVLTASADHVVRLWDLATGESTASPLRLENTLTAAAFSPDGQWLLAADGASARVWDIADGRPVSMPMATTAPIIAAYFSPDGRRVLTTSADNTSRFWDAATGTPISQPLRQRPPGPNGFGPETRNRSSASWNEAVRLWAAPAAPVPGWVLDLAQTLAQSRMDSTGAPAYSRGQPLAALRQDAASSPDAANPFVLWARRILDVNAPAASAAK